MATSTWQIDAAHTDVGFAVKHMMISTVKGRFADLEGTITIDDADPAASSVQVTINAASVDTRQEQRDAHLRSADFFDVEKYPTLTFRSRRVESTGRDRFRIVGDLTIRGVTREIVLEAADEGRGKDPWGNERAGFNAHAVIDRRDFGLTWNAALEAGGILVGNDIRISLEVEAVKAEAAVTNAA
jgi:polyisoprenoid-binding protein YceI